MEVEKKQKYFKIRASDVSLGGKPLPDWVAKPGGLATLDSGGKLEEAQNSNIILPKKNTVYTSLSNPDIWAGILAGYYINMFSVLPDENFDLELSADGINWTNVVSPLKSMLLRGTSNTSIDIPPGNYLRLTINQSGYCYLNCLVLNCALANKESTILIQAFKANEWKNIINEWTLGWSMPGYSTIRHETIPFDPNRDSMCTKLRLIIKAGSTTVSVFKAKWFGSYPNQSSPEGYTIDTGGNVTFPKNVVANYFLGKATSAISIDSGAGNADVHAVYNGCPVGLSAVRLASTTVTNLPSGISSGNGATLLCTKYDVSTGHMIFVGMGADGLWRKYKMAGAGNYGSWVRILEGTAPELCAGTIAAMNIDNIRSGDQNGALVVYKLTTGTYTGTFPSGVDPTQMNCSTLRQEMHTGTNMLQTLNYHVKCVTYMRYKFDGVWKNWVEIGGSSCIEATDLYKTKSVKSIVGAIYGGWDGAYEADLMEVHEDSPPIQDTTDGSLVLSVFDGSAFTATLYRRDNSRDGTFYKVVDSGLEDCWFIDRNGGIWWVTPALQVEYRGNIIGGTSTSIEYIYYYMINTGGFSDAGKYKTPTELHEALLRISQKGVDGFITSTASPDESNTGCTKIIRADYQFDGSSDIITIFFLNHDGKITKCVFNFNKVNKIFESIIESVV